MNKMSKMRKYRVIWHVPAFILVVAAAVAAIMLLWNALIPAIIGWGTINYWQAAGLLVLCRLLFGGFGKHGHMQKRHLRGKHAHLHEKLEGMSSQEKRDYIRKRMFEMHDFEKKEDKSGEEKHDHD